jgi:spore germination protein GerM
VNRRGARRWLIALPALLLLALLAGCGIPMDSQPRDVATPDQPIPIRQPDAAAEGGSSSFDPVVYFLAPRPNERLVAAHRPVNRTANDLMTALLGKLTTEEMSLNWRTAIPTNVTFDGAVAGTDPGTVVVKLLAPKDAASFLQGEDGVRVAAQIVYTMFGVSGTKAVQVELNGELQKLLDEEGNVLNRPAIESDYRSYDPDATDTPVDPTASSVSNSSVGN